MYPLADHSVFVVLAHCLWMYPCAVYCLLPLLQPQVQTEFTVSPTPLTVMCVMGKRLCVGVCLQFAASSLPKSHLRSLRVKRVCTETISVLMSLHVYVIVTWMYMCPSVTEVQPLNLGFYNVSFSKHLIFMPNEALHFQQYLKLTQFNYRAETRCLHTLDKKIKKTQKTLFSPTHILTLNPFHFTLW